MRSAISCDFETEGFGRCQERCDAPIVAVRLHPDSSTKHQLHEWLQSVRALRTGAKLLPGDVWQIDDRSAALWQSWQLKSPIDNATKPDGWPCACVWLVVT